MITRNAAHCHVSGIAGRHQSQFARRSQRPGDIARGRISAAASAPSETVARHPHRHSSGGAGRTPDSPACGSGRWRRDFSRALPAGCGRGHAAARSAAASKRSGDALPAHSRHDRDRIEPRHRAAPEQHNRRAGQSLPPPPRSRRAVGDARSCRRLRRDNRSVAKTRFSSSISPSRSRVLAARTRTGGFMDGAWRHGYQRMGRLASFPLVLTAQGPSGSLRGL